jgi:hypothetical protein
MASEFEATLCDSVGMAVDGKHTKTLVHNKLRKPGNCTDNMTINKDIGCIEICLPESCLI